MNPCSSLVLTASGASASATVRAAGIGVAEVFEEVLKIHTGFAHAWILRRVDSYFGFSTASLRCLAHDSADVRLPRAEFFLFVE